MLFCFLDVLLLFIFNKYKVYIILYLLLITNKNKNTRTGLYGSSTFIRGSVTPIHARTCKMIFINHKHLHVADFLKPSLYIDHKMSYIYVYWVNQNRDYVQMHENCSKYCFKEYRRRVFLTISFYLFFLGLQGVKDC